MYAVYVWCVQCMRENRNDENAMKFNRNGIASNRIGKDEQPINQLCGMHIHMHTHAFSSKTVHLVKVFLVGVSFFFLNFSFIRSFF